MKKLSRISILCLLSFIFCLSSFAQTNYSKLVNTFIGTGGHGHTYPGATVPHGMVQLSPDTRLGEWDWDGCGGYHYSDSIIYGFTHTHLSGTGIPDYCDILLMPMTGKPSLKNTEYSSGFSHRNEEAHAGYYRVGLNNNINAELTATERVGLHHYTFPDSKNKAVVVDLVHRDEVIDSRLFMEDRYTLSGYRRSKSWARDQIIYFVIKFSEPYQSSDSSEEIIPDGLDTAIRKKIKAYFKFDNNIRNLYVKVALSTVSVDGAKKNLEAELPGWDFEKTKAAAEQKWNTELGKIDVQGDEEKKKIFYTALYHTAVVPNINMDVDGNYRGRDNHIHHADGFTYYSVFSLWDTYRAAHPLYTIIDRKRTLDYIKTFLAQYKEGGKLPVWELASNETECMIGYHCIPVIVDAYMKGITDFDTSLALKAMLHSANMDNYGLAAYKSKGMIESDDEQESVSRTLEYSYDDWCIATFAKAIGNQKVYDEFIKRAQYYKNVLDPKTGFMRPRKNGDWLSPFDPKQVDNNFTEANSWQYSFYMPQDIGGYLELIGGPNALEKKLDNLFSTSSDMTGRDQSDITGLIGQYAHGNEPSHHIAYLYNYAQASYKTQEKVHKIMTEFYKNEPDGLIGNEDCGQMSAWYVMSAMGLYQVTPASNKYDVVTPIFDSVTVHLENSKQIKINVYGRKTDEFYISYSRLESGKYKTGRAIDDLTDNLSFSSEDLENGANIRFKVSDKAQKFFGENALIIKNTFVINPVIEGGKTSFQNSRLVSITSPQQSVRIFYTTDGSNPDENGIEYKEPIKVDRSETVKAIAVDYKGNKSFVVAAIYKKMEHDWGVKLNTNYEGMYDGGGALGLIDGIHGDKNWRKGNWQGYQKNDVNVTIDLKKTTNVMSVSAGFLQDTRAWIIMPKTITVEVSDDGENFTEISKQENLLPIEDLDVQLKTAIVNFPPVKTRYVRLKAVQYGKLPSWHEGAGGDSHIFIDEIEIR